MQSAIKVKNRETCHIRVLDFLIVKSTCDKTDFQALIYDM